MRTWWDPQSQAWYTQDANGAIRPATSGEVLLAIGNGYTGAPAGAPSPGATSPTPSLNPNPDQPPPTTVPGGAATIPAPTPPAPTPPPAPTGWGTGYGGQPPPSGWGTGFTGGTPRAESPFASITGQQQAYYQLNPDLANNLLRSWLAPNANSPFAGYIDSRMPDLQKQYAVASGEGGNTGLQYTDWLKQNYGQLASGFANLSQSQRGENPLSFGGGFAGRFTG